jgi:hypothetical protein
MFMNGEHVWISKESLAAFFKTYYLKIRVDRLWTRVTGPQSGQPVVPLTFQPIRLPLIFQPRTLPGAVSLNNEHLHY